jgi:two-component system phosphate regulon sensor histidine kinase PhoR
MKMGEIKTQRNTYRKNYFLVFAFIIVLTVSLVVAMNLAITLTRNNVESEFYTRKGEVVEFNLAKFNDFFQNKIPEISFYQGYLDSATASTLADTILRTNPFVQRILFYDLLINNNVATQYGFSANNLVIYPVGIYEFSLREGQDEIQDVKLQFDHQRKRHSNIDLDDFNNMALKFSSFLERVDTSKVVYGDELFRVFYSVTPGKISYMNIPRNDDLKTFKELMDRSKNQPTFYEQDMFTFFIDPTKLHLQNPIPDLYQYVEIIPLVYDNINLSADVLITESPLPGAMGDYKIIFTSSRAFLAKEINGRLYPIMGGILLIYLFLIMFAYLIYRNLFVNQRMFKLQYDFINNLTHEFKTPVSVIKIAGNNISSAKQLSDAERKLYGRILDQESDKLNNLMNTLLSFTQIENKSFKLKKEEVDLNEFCSGIVTATQLKYPDMQLEWKVKYDGTFYTDPVLLGSIFQNLIDNAYKYSKPDRRYLKIHIFEQKNLVVMTFTDKGIGIEKRELEHIFKKFYRVQSQYNQQGSVGLGLAFCRELVNFMGGKIYAESEIEKGTIFTINLPID